MTRDRRGYANARPDPAWPNGARVAVNFAINIEEGSEYCAENGDPITDWSLSEAVGIDVGITGRDLAAESMYDYGSRVGIWRLLRLFADRDMPFTAFACAQALEKTPEIARAIADSGADLCCHGWRWVKHWTLTEAEERDHIARAVESLRRTVGAAPTGWTCRYGPSVNTRRLLVEHGGFLYDSDAYDDELPYWTRVADRPHLIVPYSLVTNDCKLAPGTINTAGEFFALLRDAFDWLHAEGKRQPGMMSIGVHPRMIGHAARIGGLARFLDHVAAHGDSVWVTGREAIARHWMARFPAPPG